MLKHLLLLKVNWIVLKTLVSQTLIDSKISHEEFIIILNEEDKYKKKKKMKEDIRAMKSSDEGKKKLKQHKSKNSGNA